MGELLMAGFAVEKITPPLGVTMAGYAARKGGATGVHDDLYAHVMFLKQGSQSAVVISLDLEEVPDDLVKAIREHVSADTSIPVEAILVAATHTHSGPLVGSRLGENADPAVVEGIRKATTIAAVKAAGDLETVRIKVGSASVRDVAKNRRSLEPSPDPEVNFIGFHVDTQLIGCVVNFPLHATVLGAENRLYTADYPGYLRRTIQERHPGCCTLFLNGAAGNLNIGYSADASALGERFDFRTFENAAEVGKKLGTAVVTGLDAADWVDEPIIEVRHNQVPLPLKSLPSIAELDGSIAQLTRKMNELCVAGASPTEVSEVEIATVYLKCLKDSMLRRGIEGQQELAMPLQAVRIGPAILLAIPGELFVELGLAVRRSRRDMHVFIVGYANGAWGYLPNRDAFDQGGYEVQTSIFDENMGEALVRGASELVSSFAG